MKNLISLLLILALVCFLAICNPTLEEYSEWYARQCYPEADSAVEQIMENFTQYLAQTADRTDCKIFSIYTHDGHTTLGIALRFYPLDELSDQAADLRADYAAWLEENADAFDHRD